MSADNVTVRVSDDTCLDYKIDATTLSSTIIGAAGSWGNITTSAYNGTSASGYYGNTNYTVSSNQTSSGLTVKGDADFEGNVKINGVSIVDAIEKINKRLSILVPDPTKLAHFEALKRAYENYKTLESLCEIPKNDE